MNKYYLIEEELQKRFFKIPQAFTYEEKYKAMSRDSKYLYGILLNRYSLSIDSVENNNDDTWVDEKGRIYFVFDQKELSKLFGSSEKTLRKYLDELKKYELLEVKTMGQGKANRLYLKKPSVKEWASNIKDIKTKKEKEPSDIGSTNTKKTNPNNSICDKPKKYAKNQTNDKPYTQACEIL